MKSSTTRRGEFLAFCRPTIEDDEIAEVVDSLRSGWITSGPKVVRFEQAFCDRLGAEHAIAVNSGTAALHLGVVALDLKPGDEVIVPSLTWASTANVVEHCGGRAVFADVDADTLCVDPVDVERRITPRTRAIIPVHFAGQSADLHPLMKIARTHDLAVIEDAAHALGTAYRGAEIGATGEMVAFSFHPIKNITTGEGGMLVCRDGELAQRLRLLRFHGVSKNAWKRYQRGGAPQFEVVEPGWKYNMLDLQAALGLCQIAKLDRFNEARRNLAARYAELLDPIPEITPLGTAPYPAVHAWHLYVVRLDLDAVSLDRDAFMLALQEENIGTGLHFPPVHLHRFYAEKYGYRRGSLPNTEAAGDRIFSLPLFPLLTEHDQDSVVAAIKRVIASHHR